MINEHATLAASTAAHQELCFLSAHKFKLATWSSFLHIQAQEMEVFVVKTAVSQKLQLLKYSVELLKNS